MCLDRGFQGQGRAGGPVPPPSWPLHGREQPALTAQTCNTITVTIPSLQNLQRRRDPKSGWSAWFPAARSSSKHEAIMEGSGLAWNCMTQSKGSHVFRAFRRA
ncbi:unnamed protein product [Pleuronectes platessa]|uniref:Uncharacterized protein n=1 Tax=Pleuronectes platessa TaxID=8262 RepID=A0A9N7TTI2_PLEPL|nr:unnamed protein product [Pleuronectes platessa]